MAYDSKYKLSTRSGLREVGENGRLRLIGIYVKMKSANNKRNITKLAERKKIELDNAVSVSPVFSLALVWER